MNKFKKHNMEHIKASEAPASTIIEKEDFKVEDKSSESTFSVSSARIMRYLIITAAILVFLNIVAVTLYQLGYTTGRLPKLYAWVYLNLEANLPSFFSSLNLLVSACLLGLISILKRQENAARSKQWKILAIIFFCLSVDESVSLHEMPTSTLREMFNLSGLLYLPWVILGAAFLAVFLVYYLRFFFALPASIRLGFFVSGAIYVTGVMGIEMVGAYFSSASGENTLTYMLLVTLEETLEITGILAFNAVLLKYIREYTSNSLAFTFK